LLVVKKQLLACGEHKFVSAIRALQLLVDEIHDASPAPAETAWGMAQAEKRPSNNAS
jgi:hypothetical protein